MHVGTYPTRYFARGFYISLHSPNSIFITFVMSDVWFLRIFILSCESFLLIVRTEQIVTAYLAIYEYCQMLGCSSI